MYSFLEFLRSRRRIDQHSGCGYGDGWFDPWNDSRKLRHKVVPIIIVVICTGTSYKTNTPQT